MQHIDRFALKPHQGPYESWGTRSELLMDGVATDLWVSGHQLLHQIEAPAGYVLVTDYDCPFEEVTCFTLVSRGLKVVSWRWFGAPYATCLLEDLAVQEGGAIRFVLNGGGSFHLTLRRRWIPYLWPRMKFRRGTVQCVR